MSNHNTKATRPVKGFTDSWSGCYKPGGWRGVITEDSLVHPGRFARGLIDRIVVEGLRRGWFRPDDVIGDPMAGVGCGGIIFAGMGFRYWIGVELEETFVILARMNFEKNHVEPFCSIHQGDARTDFARIVHECGAIVTSPPYSDVLIGKGNIGNAGYSSQGAMKGKHGCSEYGKSTGQIGNLREGDLDAVVTSPPFAESIGAQPSETLKRDAALGLGAGAKSSGYGTADGQIGAMSGGDIDAVVTSPPFETQQPLSNPAHTYKGFEHIGSVRRQQDGYGDSEAQIGREKGETYWRAMRDVYHQCALALKPGGTMVLTLKDYVRGGQRVPFCDNTRRLVGSLGFTMIERIRAWQLEHDDHPALFGGTDRRTVERKSFFRRNAEKKGAPPIDYEEVHIYTRTGEAQGCRP